MEENTVKSGYATIIGRPNVGKSTLLNKLMGQKLAITSNKPQTTRNRIRAVLTEEDKGQIVFLDTPGIHKAGNKLGEYMYSIVKESIGDVDVIIYLVDISFPIKVSDKKIIETLKDVGKPVILGINKIDMIRKEQVLPIINAYEELMEFAGIFPFSARNGKGCEELLDCVFDSLPVGPFFYDPDEYTDQTERQLVSEIIREKSLHALRDEIPHGIAVTVESMKERKKSKRDYPDAPEKTDKNSKNCKNSHKDGRSDNKSETISPKEREINSTHVMDIEATIYCEKDSHKGIIIGKGGSMLKKIGTNARYEIEKMLEEPVNLQLHVKVRKDWRDNIGLLKSFGYTENKD